MKVPSKETYGKSTQGT